MGKKAMTALLAVLLCAALAGCAKPAGEADDQTSGSGAGSGFSSDVSIPSSDVSQPAYSDNGNTSSDSGLPAATSAISDASQGGGASSESRSAQSALSKEEQERLRQQLLDEIDDLMEGE